MTSQKTVNNCITAPEQYAERADRKSKVINKKTDMLGISHFEKRKEDSDGT